MTTILVLNELRSDLVPEVISITVQMKLDSSLAHLMLQIHTLSSKRMALMAPSSATLIKNSLNSSKDVKLQDYVILILNGLSQLHMTCSQQKSS